jgi:LysR family transcriptional regulator, glycine cleavage system transcriptional activator
MNRSPHRLLPLNPLRAFEAAARHLSFTQAAEELGVTQGAVSRHIRALEDRLGFPLFMRTPRACVSTREAGFMPRCCTMPSPGLHVRLTI